MNKLIMTTLLACAVMTACAGATAKDVAVPVLVDGWPVKLSPSAITRNGKAYVSLRALATALGACTRWDAKSRTAVVTVGNKRTRIAQSKGITIKGALFLPLRATGEAVGCTVEWDSSQRAISITSEAPAPRGGG